MVYSSAQGANTSYAMIDTYQIREGEYNMNITHNKDKTN